MGFDDELKQGPVEREPEHKHGGSDAEQRKERVDLPKREEPKGAVAAEHEQLAVGDIEHAQDAERQRQTGGGQTVETADQETENELLSKNHRVIFNRKERKGRKVKIHHEGHEDHEVGAKNFSPLQITLRVLRALRGEKVFGHTVKT